MNICTPSITWLAPENKIYFIAYAVALSLMIYRWWRSYAVITLLGRSVKGHSFLYNLSFSRFACKNICWLAALFFIFLTLLHPAWHKKEKTITQESRDLFIALDISRSMLAQDVSPNRLEFAKKKIKTLVDSLAADRIGLILFSGSSFVQCPLTKDRTAFFMFLDQVDTSTIASGSTALDQAIAQALQAFSSNDDRKNKLLVIFTDGEDFSDNLTDLKNQAREQSLTIFTVGIGTHNGAPIPMVDHTGKSTGHLRDKAGSVVISRLDETVLQKLAQDVGGTYIQSSTNTSDIAQLTQLVTTYEKEKDESLKISNYDEQYPLILTLSFILLALEWLL